jgi:phage tail-like protein
MTRRADWLLGQLPMGMMDDDFFVRFVSLFQDVATSFLEDADNIPNVVDVTVAPLPVVRWLGSWIGMTAIDSSLPDGLQRRLVREAGRILEWRGTRIGLERFLEVVTGAPAEVTESGGILREGEAANEAPFVRMRVQSVGWLSNEDFVELVADEIPANVTFELFVGDQLLWPVPSTALEGA